jgi:hypothetical protein
MSYIREVAQKFPKLPGTGLISPPVSIPNGERESLQSRPRTMFSLAIQDSNNTGNRPEIIQAVYFMYRFLYSQNKLFK